MDTSKSELADEFLPFFRSYKDGRIERLMGTDVVPPSIDSQTGVSSKDVIIESETGLSARLYLPKIIDAHHKLPLLIYFHGGGFCVESAFSPTYHHYLNSLVSMANVVALSVDYRRAPEHPLPIAYDDSWAALQWAASHSNGAGSESWLRDYADLERVFLAGDSSGANIAHNMAMRAGAGDDKLVGDVKVFGVVLVHSYFWGEERIGSEAIDPIKNMLADKMWLYACRSTTLGNDDPLINPFAVGAPNLSGLGCTRVLVCVAEKDVLRDRGWLYYETLRKSGWGGVVEIMETEGEDHVFHLFNPTCEKALNMIVRLASFMNRDEAP